MHKLRCKLIIVAGIGLLTGLSAPLSAQDASERAVEQYTCKEVLRESGSNRDVAIAFLHGFLLGKSGQSKFDVQVLREQTDKFLDSCLDHPGDKAVDIMAKVKG